MFAQAGLYSHDSINPFSESKIEYFISDMAGEITFPHVKFTDYGVGDEMHQQKFACDGVFKTTGESFVLSRVADSLFTWEFKNTYSISHPTYTTHHFVAYILVVDENKKPLRGKVAKSVKLIADTYVGEIRIVYNHTLFSESKEDGVMQMPIKILCLKEDTI